VLGGLLESKDLESVWPIRVILSSQNENSNPNSQFVSQNRPIILRTQTGPPLHGQHLFVLAKGTRLPLEQVAGILLNDNTPRLPAEIESGLLQLLGTIQAHGSHVTWGGPPVNPDLAWARIHLFATKFEYSASFHIFLTNARSVTVQTAEHNSFGKDAATLEKEAAATLAIHDWQPVPISGRPLDPKRDFGEHSLDEATLAVYLADAQLPVDPTKAEAAYQAAVAAGGPVAALGFEGLADIALADKENPKPLLDQAIAKGSHSAPVYLHAAEGLPDDQALPLLMKAALLNPAWAEPLVQQARLTSNGKDKVALLKKATELDPRGTEYWIDLAQAQTAASEGTAAQGSWLRAEDSAETASERERVHQLRLDSEQARLDAVEEATSREREAPHLANQRAERSETARIRAAEKRANAALDSAAGGDKPETVVPWSDVIPQKKLTGKLTKVECLGSRGRLTIQAKEGTVQLLVPRMSDSGLACGAQQPVRRITLTYAAQPDDRFGTVGNVTILQVQ